MSLNDEEKKELREVSTLMAYSKVQSLCLATTLLQAAEAELRYYPELRPLRERIREVCGEIPNYADQFLRQVVGIEPEEFDYYEPNDYDRLRLKEARARGVPLPEEEDEAMEELEHEDPLALIARLVDNPRST